MLTRHVCISQEAFQGFIGYVWTLVSYTQAVRGQCGSNRCTRREICCCFFASNQPYLGLMDTYNSCSLGEGSLHSIVKKTPVVILQPPTFYILKRSSIHSWQQISLFTIFFVNAVGAEGFNINIKFLSRCCVDISLPVYIPQ